MCLVVLLLCMNFSNGKYTASILIFGILSLILYSLPLLSAFRISKSLPQQLANSFGSKGNSDNNSPFSFINLTGFNNSKKVKAEAILYDNADHLTLDFYKAKNDKLSPCIIVVHGGSWSGGDNKQLPELNSHLSLKGYHVAAINYRLAPVHESPAPLEDISRAIQYLVDHADSLKIDTGKFILLGRSAGAQIAMAAAYSFNDTRIRGVIGFYGPSDMIWGYHNPSSKLIMDSKKIMEDYLGGTYSQIRNKYIESSPLELLNARSVPTLLIHGENDPLVAYEHSRRMNLKLNNVQIPHYLLTLPWATHGCDYTLHGPSGQLSTFAIDYFLKNIIQ